MEGDGGRIGKMIQDEGRRDKEGSEEQGNRRVGEER